MVYYYNELRFEINWVIIIGIRVVKHNPTSARGQEVGSCISNTIHAQTQTPVSKPTRYMKFGTLIEYGVRNIFHSRATEKIACVANGSHFPKWPPCFGMESCMVVITVHNMLVLRQNTRK